MFSNFFILALLCLLPAWGQRNIAGAPDIALRLERLQTVGSALMIAAHPDDENTALLAWLARGRHVRSAYLSITRGEGGQNLIGPEQGDLLGVIRTQELLAARRIDGAEQFFTRAIDFGFSKTAEETLAKWGHDQVLADVVWNIRRFRPDVIVLRFSGTPRDGHGHHQSSAMLGKEAFIAAADVQRFPEQLKFVQPWQAKRLLFNFFAFNPQQERDLKSLKNYIEVDLGAYDARLGYSYGEIAGMSRSEHRSQGMGSPERKGTQKNQLVHVAGDPARKDLFDGIDLTWRRIAGGAHIGELLARAAKQLDPEHPEAIVPVLAEARPLITATAAQDKLAELDELLARCAGVWLDANASAYQFVPGESAQITLTAIARSSVPVTWTGVAFEGLGAPVVPLGQIALPANESRQAKAVWRVPDNHPYSEPYWLANPRQGAMYNVPDQRDIGLADSPPPLTAVFRLRVGNVEITLRRPVIHRFVDRVLGEQCRPLSIVTPVALELPKIAMVFANGSPKPVEVKVRANRADAKGYLTLEAPAGWQVTPEHIPFALAEKRQQAVLRFLVKPPAANARGELRARADLGSMVVAEAMQTLEYPHIPPQTVFPAATLAATHESITTLAHSVGYIMGAGDEEPEALRQLGVAVTLLEPEQLAAADLRGFDAIVTGVRAYNTRPDLRTNQQRLLDYVAAGGTLIVQYNVLDRFDSELQAFTRLGPYPLKLSRDRVTVEDAPVTFPDPNHPVLISPNRITDADFAGWVQERGLYFAGSWDRQYQPLFVTNDPGEAPLAGGTLFARFGKGAYIFTAYSWFRQLPAGVPGAYRIFANFLSASKTVNQP